MLLIRGWRGGGGGWVEGWWGWVGKPKAGTAYLDVLITCQKNLIILMIDRYTVTVRKEEDIIDHMSRKILFLCSVFMKGQCYPLH